MGLFLPGNERSWASYDLETADKLGLNEAIVLAQMISSIEGHIDRGESERFFRDGRWWMYDSMPALCKNTSIKMDAIRRTINRLKKLEIIHAVQYELAEGRARFWYSINTEMLTKSLSLPPSKTIPRVGGMCAKPQDGGASVQNHMVGGGMCAKPQDAMCAKPQDAMCAKPHDLSITLNSITLNPITLNNIPPAAPVIALEIRKPRTKRETPPKKAKELKYTAEELELAQAWLDYAIEELDGSKPQKTWTVESFAEGLMKTMKATDLDLSKMWEVLKFVRVKPLSKEPFSWYPNATSPHQLLKVSKTNAKRKIENILSSMKNDNQPRRNYERPKAVDLSADNGKFANCNDAQPW